MNNTLSLQDLFHNRVFRVPDYQRGYAWEEQQVGEFLDDLSLLTSSRRHYTGTVVLYQPESPSAIEKTDNEGTSYVEAKIVDGQQRLTTVALLLNGIARALSEYEGSSVLAQGIRKNYVETTDIDGHPLYKLSLNNDTDDFFKKNVLPETPGVAGPKMTSEKRLLDAKEQIAKHLRTEGGDQASKEQRLRDLYNKVTTRLHFSLYEVEDEAEVGVIFEVMNDRGKPLTELEKVKNYLLYTSSSLDVSLDNRKTLTDSVNNAWAAILSNLMAAGLASPTDEDQLLRTHWIMRYDPQSRKWEGSKSIRRSFDLREYQGRHDQLLSDLHKYVNGLRDACVCFCDARNPDRTDAFSGAGGEIRSKAILWNSKLIRIRTTASFLPLLMAVRVRWPDRLEEYLQTVQLCEVFAFRSYRVVGHNSNYGQPALFRIAYDVANGQAELDDAVRRIKELMATWANRWFDEFMAGGEPEDWYSWSGLKYFLYEYEHYLALAKGASPRVSFQEIEKPDTIEHVLPQSIEHQPYWRERFGKAKHQKYMHDIGNLTLTKDNSYYSNKPFPDKKGSIHEKGRCYATAPLFQEQELAERDGWTAEAIDERRATLLAWAKERWRVDFTGIHSAELDDEADDDEIADEEGEE